MALGDLSKPKQQAFKVVDEEEGLIVEKCLEDGKAVMPNDVEPSDSPVLVSVPLLIGASIFSSVSLVSLNKVIFLHGFPLVATLTALHFIVTASVLQFFARKFQSFTIRYLPFFMNVCVASFGVGSICLMNFSLKYNSIGFYQMMKLCIIPCCLLLTYLQYQERTSRKIVACLVLVVTGVGISTVTDVHFNLLGTLIGVTAVFTTSQYQIWQGKKQETEKMSSMQLANSVAIPQIFITFILAFALERHMLKDFLFSESSSEFDYSQTYLAALILVSCLLAATVNIVTFALIGRTSAVTFQVIGHGKTCLLLFVNYLIFIFDNGDIRSLYVNFFGVVIALCGVVLYGNVKQANGNSKDFLDKCLPDPLLRVLTRKSDATMDPNRLSNI